MTGFQWSRYSTAWIVEYKSQKILNYLRDTGNAITCICELFLLLPLESAIFLLFHSVCFNDSLLFGTSAEASAAG